MMNVSCCSVRANSLRRFTHGPRLVVPVTSGEVVTMRDARSLSPLDRSSRILPKPICVDSSRSVAISTFGTSSTSSV